MTDSCVYPCESHPRTSDYTIYVELEDNPDEILLIHGYSGASDVVSKPVARFLVDHGRKAPPKPLYGSWRSGRVLPELDDIDPGYVPSDETLEILLKRGYLSAVTHEEEHGIVERLVNTLRNKRSQSLSFLVIPTYNCNLRCHYCFQRDLRSELQDTMLTTPENITNPLALRVIDGEPVLKVMDTDMADRLLLGMKKLHDALEDGAPPPTLGFFGGEPLLPETHAIVAYLMNKFGEMFGPGMHNAITNGTNLHEFEDLLGPEVGKLASLQITLDGPKRMHDQRRVGDNDAPSYDKIISAIKLASSKSVSVSVRVNVDKNNIDELRELSDELVSFGFKDDPNVTPYVAPITDTSSSIRASHLLSTHQLNERMKAMAAEHPNMKVFDDPESGVKMKAYSALASEETWVPPGLEFCGAHGGMYVVDALGDAYACWEHAGFEQERIGFFDEDSDYIPQELHTTWRTRSIISNPVCGECRFAFFCGGGCAELAKARTDTIHHSYCDAFAARFMSGAAGAYKIKQAMSEPVPVALSKR